MKPTETATRPAYAPPKLEPQPAYALNTGISLPIGSVELLEEGE